MGTRKVSLHHLVVIAMALGVSATAHAQMPGSQWVELKNCAHWPQWEKPEEFNRIVREFAGRA